MSFPFELHLEVGEDFLGLPLLSLENFNLNGVTLVHSRMSLKPIKERKFLLANVYNGTVCNRVRMLVKRSYA